MKLRSLSLALLFSLAAAATGCAGEVGDSATTNDENEIVNVAQTDVERQSIGNCWLYAHASWIESMNKTATGEDFDVSQSYWTYWHWFDQIAGGFSAQISTGGNWTTANNIVRKYGLMAEKDFIFADTLNEMSSRQKTALDALNESLKTGELKDSASRRDKKKVRQEMDRAWGLSAEQSAMLDQVFGETVSRTLSGSANAAGTTIIRAQDFDVSYSPGPNRARVTRKLSQAMSDWRQVYYSGADRRGFLLRVQKALHAEQPVVITWFVDFNAMENGQNERRGSFNMTTLGELGPGSQGGHMTVLEDYQAKLADGTVLKAGETLDPSKPSDKRLLDRALDTRTQIQFLRVKNSWGAARPDRAFAPGMPGYHDLYLDYLNGPVKRCTTKADGTTDTSNCPFDHTPLQNVVLPPGY
ncbi:MAG: hypothetical protein KF764_07180 [Labilithrix sp.]|nr:hypothetical protein [Labilithrix sp.]MBX3220217.1 hypothetical protein [Labilithrix sp.]